MKVVLAIPREDQVINEFVKKWPKVEVLNEFYDICSRKEMGDLPFNTDVIVISEDINSDYHKVIDFINWWRCISKRSHIILLSNAKADHILLKECMALGGSVINNLPNLSLVNLAKTMFIGNPGQGVNARTTEENLQAKQEKPVRTIDQIKLYQGIQGVAAENSNSLGGKVTGINNSSFIIKRQPALHDLVHTDRSLKTNVVTGMTDNGVGVPESSKSRPELQILDNDNLLPDNVNGRFENMVQEIFKDIAGTNLDKDSEIKIENYSEQFVKTPVVVDVKEHITYLPKQIREFVCDPTNLDYLQLIYHLKVDRRLSVKSIATIIDHCSAIKALLKEMG